MRDTFIWTPRRLVVYEFCTTATSTFISVRFSLKPVFIFVLHCVLAPDEQFCVGSLVESASNVDAARAGDAWSQGGRRRRHLTGPTAPARLCLRPPPPPPPPPGRPAGYS